MVVLPDWVRLRLAAWGLGEGSEGSDASGFGLEAAGVKGVAVGQLPPGATAVAGAGEHEVSADPVGVGADVEAHASGECSALGVGAGDAHGWGGGD